jgi:hypothetical protein
MIVEASRLVREKVPDHQAYEALQQKRDQLLSHSVKLCIPGTLYHFYPTMRQLTKSEKRQQHDLSKMSVPPSAMSNGIFSANGLLSPRDRTEKETAFSLPPDKDGKSSGDNNILSFLLSPLSPVYRASVKQQKPADKPVDSLEIPEKSGDCLPVLTGAEGTPSVKGSVPSVVVASDSKEVPDERETHKNDEVTKQTRTNEEQNGSIERMQSSTQLKASSSELEAKQTSVNSLISPGQAPTAVSSSSSSNNINLSSERFPPSSINTSMFSPPKQPNTNQDQNQNQKRHMHIPKHHTPLALPLHEHPHIPHFVAELSKPEFFHFLSLRRHFVVNHMPWEYDKAIRESRQWLKFCKEQEKKYATAKSTRGNSSDVTCKDSKDHEYKQFAVGPEGSMEEVEWKVEDYIEFVKQTSSSSSSSSAAAGAAASTVATGSEPASTRIGPVKIPRLRRRNNNDNENNNPSNMTRDMSTENAKEGTQNTNNIIDAQESKHPHTSSSLDDTSSTTQMAADTPSQTLTQKKSIADFWKLRAPPFKFPIIKAKPAERKTEDPQESDNEVKNGMSDSEI